MLKIRNKRRERWKLADNTEVWLRPIGSGDAPFLVDIFNHMSDESRYQRFNTTLANVDEERVQNRAQQMVDQSVNNGRGWLAFAQIEGKESPLGGARYVYTDEDVAEFAISVRDDIQQKGLGTLLLLRLIQTAKRDKLEALTGFAQADNRGLWQLLDRSGYPIERERDGSDVFFRMPLN